MAVGVKGVVGWGWWCSVGVASAHVRGQKRRGHGACCLPGLANQECSVQVGTAQQWRGVAIIAATQSNMLEKSQGPAVACCALTKLLAKRH